MTESSELGSEIARTSEGKKVQDGDVSSEGGLTLPLPQRGSLISGRAPVTHGLPNNLHHTRASVLWNSLPRRHVILRFEELASSTATMALRRSSPFSNPIDPNSKNNKRSDRNLQRKGVDP